MDDKEIFNLDLEVRLINNRPLYAYVVYLYSPTINEISDMGVSTYNTYLTLLCSTFEELESYGLLGDSKCDNVFDWLLEQCLLHTNFESYILNGLSMFFREKVSCSGYFFYIDDLKEQRFINKELFDYIQDILRKMCCMESIQEDKENPANEKARQLLEKKKKYNQKLKKLKQQEEDTLNLSDLISIYCADGNGASLLTVGQYTMYQFNDQFNRMTMLQDYNVNVQALLHGADNKDGLETWMRKIKAED